MPRNAIYFHDFEGPDDWRFRFVFIPADLHTSPLSIAGPAPAWGDDPAPGSGYIKMPEGVLYAAPLALSESGHDGVFVGLHGLPTMKFAFNLWNLTGGPGVVDGESHPWGWGAFDDMRRYLIRPKVADGGEIFDRVFPTTNFFKLTTDQGDRTRSATSIGTDSFFVAFAGAQQAGLDTKIGPVDEASQTAPLTVEVQNLMYLCLSNVQTADITAAVMDGVRIENYGSKRTDILFDGIWWSKNDKSENKFFWAGQRGGMLPLEVKNKENTVGGGSKIVTSPQLHAEMFRVVDIWHAMGTCMSTIYLRYVRGSILNDYVTFTSRFTTTGGGYNIGTNGTGFDNWQMYVHAHLPNGADNGVLSRGNQWLCGWIYDDDDNRVGGYFFDGGTADKSPGIRKWKTLYDYVEDAFRGGVAKIIVQSLGPIFWTYYIAGIFENIGEGASETIGHDDFKDKPTASPGAHITLGATVDLPTRWEDDPEKYENRPDENSPDLAVAFVAHNLPDSRGDYGKTSRNFHHTGGGTWFDGEAFGAYTLGFRTSTIYYETSPDFLAGGGPAGTGSVFVRVHERARLWLGTRLANDQFAATTYPTPTDVNSGMFVNTSGQAQDIWIKHLRTAFSTRVEDAFIELPFRSGMPYVASIVIPRIFGDDQQTEYETSVALSALNWQKIGQRVSVVTFGSGNALADDLAWLSDLPGAPIITRTADDYGTGNTKIKLFAIDPVVIEAI